MRRNYEEIIYLPLLLLIPFSLKGEGEIIVFEGAKPLQTFPGTRFWVIIIATEAKAAYNSLEAGRSAVR